MESDKRSHDLIFPTELEPIRKFIDVEISIDEFWYWLKMTTQSVVSKVDSVNAIVQIESDLRRAIVREANASIALEGFTLDPEVVLLNEQYIHGEITLEQKLQSIFKLYSYDGGDR